MLGELPDLPHLPELPAAVPGADLIGRGAALLVDLPVDLQPSGWRLVDRPGRDLRRAPRPAAPGPRRAGGASPQGTPGRSRSRSPGRGRWPRRSSCPTATRPSPTPARPATWPHRSPRASAGTSPTCAGGCRAPGSCVQLDEPSLPAVLAGRVPTASGFGRLRAVEAAGRRSRRCARCWRRRRAGAARRSCTAARRRAPSAAPGAGARRGLVRPRPCSPRPTDERARRARSRPASALLAGVVPTGSADDRPRSATAATRSGPCGACGAGSASRPSGCPARSWRRRPAGWPARRRRSAAALRRAARPSARRRRPPTADRRARRRSRGLRPSVGYRRAGAGERDRG